MAVVMAVIGVVGVASPASAGSALEAARNICEADGYNYVFVHSYGLDPAGTGSARVYLFYSNGNGKNCVVTRKYSLYNLATPMTAGVRVTPGGTWVTDGPRAYYTYAGPVRVYARNTCVQYHGYFNNGQDSKSFTSGAIGCN